MEHVRHKPPRELKRPRDLVLAVAPLRSNVNLSRIIRSAGCCGVATVYACGTAKVESKIARDGADEVELRIHRTLPPVLRNLQNDGFSLVGLEQTTDSHNLHEYRLPRRCAFVIGNERHGLSDDILQMLDAVVEIPVWGMPHSYNVASATDMALYEYCRQFPDG